MVSLGQLFHDERERFWKKHGTAGTAWDGVPATDKQSFEVAANAVASRVRAETIEECARLAKAYRDKCKPLFFEHNGPIAVILAGAAEQIEVDIRALNREPVTSGE